MEETLNITNGNPDNETCENEKNEENQKRRVNVKLILAYVNIGILSIVQALTVISFAFGMASAFGENVTLIQCFYIISDLFKYNPAIAYKLIISALLAVLYTVIFVFMVIKFIKMFKLILFFVKSKRIDTMRLIKANCAQIFILCLIFMLVSDMAYVNKLNSMTIFIICLTVFALTFHEGVNYICASQSVSLTGLLIKCLNFLLNYTAISIIFILFKYPALSDALKGLKILFSGLMFANVFALFINLFNYLAVPIIYLVCVSKFLKVCSSYFAVGQFNKNETRNGVKKLWITSIVIVALQFVFNGLIKSKFIEISFSIITAWWYSVKSLYFPLFLLLSAWLLTLRFSPEKFSNKSF